MDRPWLLAQVLAFLFTDASSRRQAAHWSFISLSISLHRLMGDASSRESRSAKTIMPADSASSRRRPAFTAGRTLPRRALNFPLSLDASLRRCRAFHALSSRLALPRFFGFAHLVFITIAARRPCQLTISVDIPGYRVSPSATSFTFARRCLMPPITAFSPGRRRGRRTFHRISRRQARKIFMPAAAIIASICCCCRRRRPYAAHFSFFR